MKMTSYYSQIATFIGWIVFAFMCVLAYRFSQQAPAWYKVIAWGGFAFISVGILCFWWKTAYAGSGVAHVGSDSRSAAFAWGQIWTTLIKVGAQTLILALAVLILYALPKQLGEKALPHLLGIDFKPQWFPNAQVVLPCAVFYGSILAAALCVWLIILAVQAYGFISPMLFGSLAGLVIIVGSWAWYEVLFREKRSELQQKTIQIEAMRKNESRDAQLKNTASLDKDTLLSRYRRLVEYRLGTREWNAMVFHRMADEPFGLAFRFPGYLIGVEQTNRYLIDVPPGDNVAAAGKGVKGIAALLNDRRRTFVSHIVEFEDRDPGTRDAKSAPNAEMVRTNMLYNIYESARYDHAFTRSFTELNALRERLESKMAEAEAPPPEPGTSADPEKAKPYTHILVYCMGWNTDQQESIRNYNSLMGYLAEAADKLGGGKPFRPLVIGISWPSEWSYLKPLSYVSKAGDADETGLVWGSYLLKRVLEPLKVRHKVPLILIGHSFGSRVLTRAVASDPDWIKGVPEPHDPIVHASLADTTAKKIDLFVGLQGAVSANRFVATGALTSGWQEGSPYSELVKRPTRFIFTWAENDKANPVAAYVTGAHHMGGKIGNEFCLQHQESFWPVIYKDGADGMNSWDWPYREKGRQYDPKRGWNPEAKDVKGRIFTIDVSSIVKERPYGKGGGAHSDIYTPEMGRFLWESIRAFAPI
ncbi:MAG: hypothetical protein JF616_15550 [Fibrobacteres bacterium]|jgi:hypothetical protein|nr:hypothetical protein [Fibrobacterota bacterium]